MISKSKVKNSLRAAIDQAMVEIGGWEKYLNSGDKVLLKANFNTADPYPGSTDKEFLKTVIELVHSAGAGEVIIGASSTLQAKTDKVLKKLGIYELQEGKQPARIHNFDEHRWVKREIRQGKHLQSVSLPAIMDEIDKLVLLPCCKTHFIARYTGALKLAVGLMRPRERMAFHLGHIEEKIAEMNTVFSPDLVIMDARICFIDRGPMDGTRKEPNLILASDSRLAIDTEGMNIIKSYEGNSLSDIAAEELTQIKLAKELGIK